MLQAIAAENNLAETAFFVPQNGTGEGDYRLRWFTPAVEVPLCGHATLASAYVSARHIDPQMEKVVFHSANGQLQVTRAGPDFPLALPGDPPAAFQGRSAVAAAHGSQPRERIKAAKAGGEVRAPTA